MRKIRAFLFLFAIIGIFSLLVKENKLNVSAGEYNELESGYYDEFGIYHTTFYDDEGNFHDTYFDQFGRYHDSFYDKETEVETENVEEDSSSETITDEEREEDDEQERLEEQEELEREKKRQEKRQKQINKKRKAIVRFAQKLIRGCKTKKEKLKAIHDGICKYAKYDWKLVRDGGGSVFYDDDMEQSIVDNASDMLKHKKGVCGHYASLFMECCKVIDVPCEMPDGDDHVWNEIKLGKDKYIVDVTWDDTENGQNQFIHRYFLIKEHPITRKLAAREKYLNETKLPKYKPEYKKINRNNIKTTTEFLKAMSYVNHAIQKEPGIIKTYKFKITGKNVNANMDVIYLLSWSCVQVSYNKGVFTLKIAS